MADFSLECFYNEFLPEGCGELDAILTVTAAGADAAELSARGEGQPAGCVVLIIDVSGSMGGDRIRQARKATAAAIACLRDNMRFAVVAGNETARPVYPQFGLAVATPESRSAASKEVSKLGAGGGTRIGRWITASAQLLSGELGPRRAILLTDGKNENETAQDLENALATAVGIFQCDCRGVGSDWVVPELRKVSSALLGSLGLVAQPSGLIADFEQMIQSASSKSVAEMALRIWCPAGAHVELKQVVPDRIPLVGQPAPSVANAVEFVTGAWGNESRDYQLTVRVSPAEVGNRMLAARVSVLVDGDPFLTGDRPLQCLIPVEWTDDPVMSTRINRRVARHKGQEELAENLEEGLRALEDGDVDTAMARFARAVPLASELGDRTMSAKLKRIVEVVDPATGIVRLKKSVAKVDLMDLEVQTTKTARVAR